MADAPLINVVKPQSGLRMNMPKIPKVAIALITVFLALITVISAVVFYRNRATPVVPTPTGASTTTTIVDDFPGPTTVNLTKWTILSEGEDVGQTATVDNQKLHMEIPATTGTSHLKLVSTSLITGDFQAEIDVSTHSASLQYRFGFNDGQTQYAVVRSASDPLAEKLKVTRVGSIMQGFVDTGSGYVLAQNWELTSVPDGRLEIQLTAVNTSAPEWIEFDNFTAQVNISAAPTPVPGTAAACTYSFTILDIVPTLTPSVTPTGTISPSVTPSLTPTAGPSSTPTATPPPGSTPTPTIPASCNQACTTNANCSNGLTCVNGACRNPLCTTQSNCTCVTSSPTPTTPIAEGPTPTPVTLQQAGVATSTWILGLGGILLVALGGLLLVAI